MKRVFFFILTNLAVIAVLSVTLRLLGVESSLQANNVDLDYNALLIISGVIGMGGSFISLALSKWMAMRMTGAQVIENPTNDGEAWLLETVRHQAQAANIGMPTVAIFPSNDPNAFATGARRNSALVAVSTGLLQRMDRSEVEAVLAHEVSHVANGDMITLTLIQGVVNTFVVFLSRVAGHFIDRVLLKNEEGHGIGYFVAVIALPDRLRHPRQPDRHVVLAPPRVPRRRRWREARRCEQHDRGARAPEDGLRPHAAARPDVGLRHLGRQRLGPAPAVHDAPAARRADRGSPEVRVLAAQRSS